MAYFLSPSQSIGTKTRGQMAVSTISIRKDGGAFEEMTDLLQAARAELGWRFEIGSRIKAQRPWCMAMAMDHKSNTRVVLNLLPRAAFSAEALNRFRLAARRAAYLDHPHIATVQRYGITEQFVWYTRSHLGARCLAEFVAENSLSFARCRHMVEQIASALDYAHGRGISHGALSPWTVLVGPDDFVWVSDFEMDETAARFGEGRLRPAFAAPEQRRREEAGPPADQYALGRLVRECLEAEYASAAIRNGPPPSPWPLPGPAASHVAAALERAQRDQPAQRFPSIRDFAGAFAGESLVEPPVPAGESAAQLFLPDPQVEWERQERRLRLTVLATSLIATAALTVLALQLWDDRAPELGSDTKGYETLLPSAAKPGPEPEHPLDLPTTASGSGGQSDATEPERMAPLGPARPMRSSPTRTREAGSPSPADRPAESPARRAEHFEAPAPDRPPVPRTEPGNPGVVLPNPNPLDASRSTIRQPSFEATGRLFLNAQPWGEVFLDGRRIGNTPIIDLRVPWGEHRLRISRDGFIPYERWLEIQPGEELRITDIILRRPGP